MFERNKCIYNSWFFLYKRCRHLSLNSYKGERLSRVISSVNFWLYYYYPMQTPLFSYFKPTDTKPTALIFHIDKCTTSAKQSPDLDFCLSCTAQLKEVAFRIAMRVQYFLKAVKSTPLFFINKNQVYFKRLGFEGAFDQQNGSHKGNVRKPVLKRSKHLRCPTWKKREWASDILLPKTIFVSLIYYG